MKKFLALFAMIALCAVTTGCAPKQKEKDTTLDARAHEVALSLRCVVCKNQSIAESDAQLAKDLRALVHERLEAGDTNEEARDYVVSRYGEFVLLKPTFSGKNLVLWLGPFLVLVLALAGGIAFIFSRRGQTVGNASLTDAERDELKQLLGSGDDEE